MSRANEVDIRMTESYNAGLFNSGTPDREWDVVLHIENDINPPDFLKFQAVCRPGP
jgi:hypothetical protein